MKKANRLKILILFLVIMLPSKIAHAGMKEEMSNMFKKMGYSTNVLGAGYYEGQTRGFYTGGALSLRAPYESINPLSLTLPSVSAGCGGIDFHLGAMSYINTDKIVEKFRAIGQNAAGYVFQLALATVSPEIKSIITEFENITNMINQLNMNSCTAAKSIVDYGQRKFAEANQDACTDYETASGKTSDRIAGGDKCKTNMVDITKGLSGENRNKYSPFKNYTYEALKNVSVIKDNKALLEAILSTLGTIIIRPDKNNNPEKLYISPTISFEVLVNGGSNVQIISCKNNDCTDLGSTGTNLDGFKTFVETEMINILERIKTNQDLTNTQMIFVQSNSIPIYKILNVLSVYPYVAKAFIKKYAESIAITLAYYWIEEGIIATVRGIKNVEDVSGIMAEYQESIRQLRENVDYAMSRARDQVNNIDMMIREVQHIEDEISKSLDKGIKRGYTYASVGAK